MSSTEVLAVAAWRAPDGVSASPKSLELEWVTLPRREYLKLVMHAEQWKSLHEWALCRLEFAEKRHQFELAQIV